MNESYSVNIVYGLRFNIFWSTPITVSGWNSSVLSDSFRPFQGLNHLSSLSGNLVVYISYAGPLHRGVVHYQQVNIKGALYRKNDLLEQYLCHNTEVIKAFSICNQASEYSFCGFYLCLNNYMLTFHYFFGWAEIETSQLNMICAIMHFNPSEHKLTVQHAWSLSQAYREFK